MTRATRAHSHRRAAYLSAVILAALVLCLSGCGRGVLGPSGDGPPRDAPDLSQVPEAKPRVEPRSRYGNPSSYVVFGKHYRVMSDSRGFVERGIASWYGRKFHGRRTSSGETYDMYRMTAAHKHLPLPTYVRVTNLENGRSLVVKVNDRGPFHPNRVIDLSYAAASRLGVLAKGTALVEVRAIDPARPAPPPPVRVAPRSMPRIYLQAGAFSSEHNARRFGTRLRQDLQRSVRVQAAEDVAGPRLFRVQIGPLASVETADAVALQLQRLGIDESHVVLD